jgi:hypothetical protein
MEKNRRDDNRASAADRTVKLTWQDISEAELRAALADVKRGADPAASLRLIEYFYRRLRDNLPYDQTILFEYLEHAFGRIVDGEPADRALGLARQAPAE